GHGRAWLTTVTDSASPRGDETLIPPGSGGAVPPTPPGGIPSRDGRPPAPGGTRWRNGSLPGPRGKQTVAEAVAAIKAGGLRKVVLARDVFATAEEPLDARGLLRRGAAPHPGRLHVSLRA